MSTILCILAALIAAISVPFVAAISTGLTLLMVGIALAAGFGAILNHRKRGQFGYGFVSFMTFVGVAAAIRGLGYCLAELVFGDLDDAGIGY